MMKLALALLCCSPLWGAYSYRITATVDHTLVPSNQTNFPVLITGTVADLKTVGNGGKVQSSSGFDMVWFSDLTCSTTVPFDRASWNGTTGQVEFHVSAATLSATVSNKFYLCFGNSAITTDQATPATVWGNANYVAVYHFGDGTTLSLADSSGNSNTCTNHSATATTGIVGPGAAHFTKASSQYLDCGVGSSINLTGPLSIEVAMIMDTAPMGLSFLVGKSGGATNGYQWGIQPNSGVFANDLYFSGVNSGVEVAAYGPAIGTINRSLVASYDQGNTNHLDQYVDNNTPITTTFLSTQIGSNAAVNLYVGAWSPSLYFWDGVIDELRIRTVATTSDWATTRYNSLSNSSFVTLSGTTPIASQYLWPLPNSIIH